MIKTYTQFINESSSNKVITTIGSNGVSTTIDKLLTFLTGDKNWDKDLNDIIDNDMIYSKVTYQYGGETSSMDVGVIDLKVLKDLAKNKNKKIKFSVDEFEAGNYEYSFFYQDVEYTFDAVEKFKG